MTQGGVLGTAVPDQQQTRMAPITHMTSKVSSLPAAQDAAGTELGSDAVTSKPVTGNIHVSCLRMRALFSSVLCRALQKTLSVVSAIWPAGSWMHTVSATWHTPDAAGVIRISTSNSN